MSLKFFHVFFITFACLFGAGFAAWGVKDFRASGDVGHLLMGLTSFVMSVALALYGTWFWKNKLKDVNFF